MRGTVVAIAVVLAGCERTEGASEGGGRTLTPAEYRELTERRKQEAADEAAAQSAAALKLPAQRLDPALILRKRAADIEKVLGSGEELTGGHRRFTVEHIPVTVLFEKGRAVWYEANFGSAYKNSDEQFTAAVAWLGAAPAQAQRFDYATSVRVVDEKYRAKLERQLLVELRQANARTIERTLRDNNFDLRIVTRGKDHSTLRIKFALCGDLMLERITDAATTLISAARYKRVECTDGFQTWFFTY